MAKLEDLVLYESANSALAFREHAYGSADTAQLLEDLLALANAEVVGPRFMFIGVRDTAGAERAFVGVSAEALSTMRSTVPALAARAIEPPVKIGLRPLKIRDATIAMLCLSECDNAPYLLRESVAGQPAGVGWLRRGTQQMQLTRADLQRLFAQRFVPAQQGIEVDVAFAGQQPRAEIELPVLDLDELPSAVAAGKLRKMLAAKKDAKEALGRTETHFDRLLHAQIFGMDHAYESHSDESLRLMIDKTKDEHAAADRHYELDTRTHRLELVVVNRSSIALDSVMLRLRLPNLPGIGVADRLHSVAGDAPEPPTDYPLVTVGERVIDIEVCIGSVAAGATVAAFREPPRLWLREPAAGKSIALDYTVHARGLREPIRDTLIVRVVPTAATTRRKRPDVHRSAR
jgi:hypothetical protein